FAGRHDDAVGGFLDGVGRTDLGAGGRFAVHADDRHGLHRMRPVGGLEVDHRLALVRVALAARLDARLAADAPALVEIHGQVFSNRHGYSLRVSHRVYPGGFRTAGINPAAR